jgi:TonB family protein
VQLPVTGNLAGLVHGRQWQVPVLKSVNVLPASLSRSHFIFQEQTCISNIASIQGGGAMNIASKLLLAVITVVGIRGAYAQETQLAIPSPDESLTNPHSDQDADAVKVGSPVYVVDPVFPASSGDRNVAIVLSGTMTAQGTFENLRKAFGAPELEGPAIDAVQQWLYTPSLKGGEPARLNVFITLSSTQHRLSTYVDPDLPFPTTRRTPASGDNEEIFRIEPGRVSAPQPIYKPDPQYGETARRVKFQGTSVLGIIVGPDGATRDVWVEKQAGLGLDRKAVESVSQWRFQPAMKDGQPVGVVAHVEVSFSLF